MSLKSSICTQTCQRLDTMAFLLHYNSPSVPCWGCRVVKRKHLSVVCGNSMIEDAGRIHLVESKESIWMTFNISPTWRSPWKYGKKMLHKSPFGIIWRHYDSRSSPQVGSKVEKKICEITTNSCQFRPSHSSTPEGLGSILHRTSTSVVAIKAVGTVVKLNFRVADLTPNQASNCLICGERLKKIGSQIRNPEFVSLLPGSPFITLNISKKNLSSPRIS